MQNSDLCNGLSLTSLLQTGTEKLDLDLGSGHTAYRRVSLSLIDLCLRTKFRSNRIKTSVDGRTLDWLYYTSTQNLWREWHIEQIPVNNARCRVYVDYIFVSVRLGHGDTPNKACLADSLMPAGVLSVSQPHGR